MSNDIKRGKGPSAVDAGVASAEENGGGVRELAAVPEAGGGANCASGEGV